MLSGMLTTLTKSLGAAEDGWKQREKLVTNLFGQLVHSFFGQDALAIKDQVRPLPFVSCLTRTERG